MSKSSIFFRAFNTDDYILINKWRNDHEFQQYTVGPLRYVSLEMEKAWVYEKMMNNTKDLYWAICLNDGSRRMIGYTSINNIDHLNKKAYFGGIVIGEPDCRDGVSLLEAEIIKLDYAYNQLNLNRIYADTQPSHYSSPSLLLALGFQKEGTMRDYVYKNGKYQDIDLYSILREDYNQMSKEGVYELRNLIKRFIKFSKLNKKK